jgi:L-threonylcarbamoyladenylate synthase
MYLTALRTYTCTIVRMPDHACALSLLHACDVPLAAPSANTSGKPSPTTAQHVFHDLSGRIKAVVDGGSTACGVESTVLDCSLTLSPSSASSSSSSSSSSHTHPCVILRPGAVTKSMIEDVIGPISSSFSPSADAKSIDPHTSSSSSSSSSSSAADADADAAAATSSSSATTVLLDTTHTASGPKAPGMKYTHYAPIAPVVLVGSDSASVRAFAAAMATLEKNPQERVGVLCSDEFKQLHCAAPPANVHVLTIGSESDVSSIARGLYAGLRAFDALMSTDGSVDVIYAQEYSEEGVGMAVMNRLRKAAGNKRIV